jgi:pimeloyl-ACP methyl ester carboxylesterase
MRGGDIGSGAIYHDRVHRAPLVGLAFAASVACASSPSDPEPPDAPRWPDEVGFITLEPVHYAIHHDTTRTELTSGRARLFYAFQPADEAPETRPLAVIFNGGPGAATGILFGFSTARQSFDPAVNGGQAVGPNPASWTRFANLLYVDARGTGYSYGLTEDADLAAARDAEFGVQSFNPFVDAADLVRVVLRFLRDHPALRSAPVVMVAESYGGVRASIALDLLLRHPAYASGEAGYEDATLVDEVREHLDATLDGEPHEPARIAEQFGRQALLQPRLSSQYQNQAAGPLLEAQDSPLTALAADTGMTFTRCAEQPPPCDPYDNAIEFVRSAGRDLYDVRQPEDWSFARYDEIAPRFVEADTFEKAFGVAPADVDLLGSAARTGAFRLVDAAAGDEPLAMDLGALPAWDRYHVMQLYDLIGSPFAGVEAEALGIDRTGPRWGELFLSNLRHVRTFVTDAPFDVVIYGAALPGALARYHALVQETAVDAERLTVRYLDGEQREVRFVRYPDAGHSITLHQPQQLADDLAAWLSEESIP